MNILEKASLWLFNSFQEKIKDDFNIDELELKQIRRLQLFAIAISAFLGAVFIMAYYIPVHVFNAFFEVRLLKFSIFGFAIQVYWAKQIHSIVLTFLELYLLGFLSVFTIQRLGYILDFPNKEAHSYELHKNNLKLISLEKKQKQELELGLDPYYGMSKFALYFRLIFARLKAALSNFILKFILQRFGSRYLLKIFIDLAAMPVYAFWNAWATHKLFLRAKYYIFSVQLTEEVSKKIIAHKDDELLKAELENLLAFVVVLKRDFSEINHYYSTRMVETIGIQIQKLPPSFEITKHSATEQMESLALLFATGVILDGQISSRERRYIKSVIHKLDNPPKILVDIESYLTAYRNGTAVGYLRENGYL